VWNVQTALELERLGIPAVAVATEAFAEMGQDTARSLGLAGLPIVAAPNGFEALSRAELRDAAERLYDEVLSILRGEPATLEPAYASRVWLSALDAIGVSCAITKAHAFG
jgi:hypothetical protein